MNLRVTFDGLTFLVLPRTATNTDPSERYTVLLPEASKKASHPDGKPAHAHQAHLLIPIASVARMDAELPRIQVLARPEYSRPARTDFVLTLDQTEVYFEGRFTTRPDAATPEGWTRALDTLVNFSNWPSNDLVLDHDIDAMIDPDDLDPAAPGAQRLAARVRLMGGLLEMKVSPRFQFELNRLDGSSETRAAALEADWVAETDGPVAIRWRRFGESAFHAIELGSDAEIWIGNNCLHPVLWNWQDGEGGVPCEATRTFAMLNPEWTSARGTPDLDFKWYYHLLRSTTQGGIAEWLAAAGKTELPVPIVHEVDVPQKAASDSGIRPRDAGSPTCGKAAILR